MTDDEASERLMTTAEVAEYFSVVPETVTRWSKAGMLTTQRTLGGHRRFIRGEVIALYHAHRVGRRSKEGT